MNSFFKFHIPKRNAQCAHQREPLLPGMEIYSLLIEGENTQFHRQDFCSACWTQIYGKLSKMSSEKKYWKSKIENQKKIENLLYIERAFTLLHTLQHSPENQENEIFILCLFLAHFRQLSLRQEILKEGVTYYLYENLHKEEFFMVKAINLSQIQIESLQKSLADQLQ